MKDFIVGHLLYMPPLIVIALLGAICWAVLRKAYSRKIYDGSFWHPGLIDVGVLFGCIYTMHSAFTR